MGKSYRSVGPKIQAGVPLNLFLKTEVIVNNDNFYREPTYLFPANQALLVTDLLALVIAG